jgi:hypothetical protein
MSKAGSEPELHLELPCWSLPTALRRQLSGSDGSLSTTTRELELHLEWSPSTVLSLSCVLFSLRHWFRLVISGGVGGDLNTWLVNWRLDIS